MSSKIKAVIFDCIDTMVEPDKNSKSKIAKTLKKLSVPYCIVTNDNTDIRKLKESGMYEFFNGLLKKPLIDGKKELFNKIKTQSMNLKPQE